MKLRLSVYGLVALIAMGLFFFVPELNIGGNRALSLYQELQKGGDPLAIFGRLLFFGVMIFIALCFLLGLGRDKTGEP